MEGGQTCARTARLQSVRGGRTAGGGIRHGPSRSIRHGPSRSIRHGPSRSTRHGPSRSIRHGPSRSTRGGACPRARSGGIRHGRGREHSPPTCDVVRVACRDRAERVGRRGRRQAPQRRAPSPRRSCRRGRGTRRAAAWPGESPRRACRQAPPRSGPRPARACGGRVAVARRARIWHTAHVCITCARAHRRRDGSAARARGRSPP